LRQPSDIEPEPLDFLLALEVVSERLHVSRTFELGNSKLRRKNCMKRRIIAGSEFVSSTVCRLLDPSAQNNMQPARWIGSAARARFLPCAWAWLRLANPRAMSAVEAAVFARR
jgi:hypothetical protein